MVSVGPFRWLVQNGKRLAPTPRLLLLPNLPYYLPLFRRGTSTQRFAGLPRGLGHLGSGLLRHLGLFFETFRDQVRWSCPAKLVGAAAHVHDAQAGALTLAIDTVLKHLKPLQVKDHKQPSFPPYLVAQGVQSAPLPNSARLSPLGTSWILRTSNEQWVVLLHSSPALPH